MKCSGRYNLAGKSCWTHKSGYARSGSSLTESSALHNARTKRSLGRIATFAMLGLGMLGVAGWLAIRETPAAQRVVETIKPYDPLQ